MMFGFSPFKIAGLVFALALIAGVVFYVKHNESVKEQLLAENAQLQANINTYRDAIDTQNQTIDYLKAQQKKQAQEFLKIESKFSQMRDHNQELSDRLAEIDKSIDAAANPQAAEVVINSISGNMNRCFELISGAPLNEAEKKAKNANEFNPECPWLYTELRAN
jgi:septal ring factor EnvC (AmiA/AmiB activator)